MKPSESHKSLLGWHIRYLRKKYTLFILPLVTILCEGIEAVVFITGAGLRISLWAIVLSAIAGLLTGAFVGLLIHK